MLVTGSTLSETNSALRDDPGNAPDSMTSVHSGQSYVVASMQLMSTTFRRVDGAVSLGALTYSLEPESLTFCSLPQYTYIGNDILRAKLIQNIRRSGAISESFV